MQSIETKTMIAYDYNLECEIIDMKKGWKGKLPVHGHFY